jgi:hypothetical protein
MRRFDAGHRPEGNAVRALVDASAPLVIRLESFHMSD